MVWMGLIVATILKVAVVEEEQWEAAYNNCTKATGWTSEGIELLTIHDAEQRNESDYNIVDLTVDQSDEDSTIRTESNTADADCEPSFSFNDPFLQHLLSKFIQDLPIQLKPVMNFGGGKVPRNLSKPAGDDVDLADVFLRAWNNIKDRTIEFSLPRGTHYFCGAWFHHWSFNVGKIEIGSGSHEDKREAFRLAAASAAGFYLDWMTVETSTGGVRHCETPLRPVMTVNFALDET
ncbi:hypothetical protein GQ600_24259 [Phytophthora cactorum]|nr:hypothetical protein GQ600_24259 [Phytophthora cactorum]